MSYKETEKPKDCFIWLLCMCFHDLLLVPSGADTHTRKHADVHRQNNFKKPDAWAAGPRTSGLTNIARFFVKTLVYANMHLAHNVM